jgi:predicted nucleic acid-binding protein
MRVFADTSALIALLDEDDGRHAEAAETFAWLARTADLVTHNYVQVEALAVALRRLGQTAAQRLVDALFPIMTTVWVDAPLHHAALAAQRASASGPSLVDHVSFLVMRQEGIEVAFAFDADFALAGFKAAAAPVDNRPARQVNETAAAYGTEAGPAQLVSVTEIAQRAGRSINTVQSWRRRHRDFPPPVARLAAGPIWDWPSIAGWIAARSTAVSERRAYARYDDSGVGA